MAAAGISTLGITFGYGTETTAGTKPTSFKQLTRINALGGINIEPEQIDASALEDAIIESMLFALIGAKTKHKFEMGIEYFPYRKLGRFDSDWEL